jgi:hypothetical protein
MLNRPAYSGVALALACMSLACSGDDGDDGNASDTTGSASESSTGDASNTLGSMTTAETTVAMTTADTTGVTIADTTDATADTSEGTSDGSTGEPETGGNCQVWEIVYDLTDSEFEISDTPFGAGNQVNVVAQPYEDNDHIGPGTIVLRFQDVGGEPGGQAFISTYDVDIDFVITGPTTVTTELVVTAGPSDCGLTTGTLAGTTVAWDPAAMSEVHSVGSILCEGGLCGAGGLPNGDPVPVDDTDDQPVNPFVLAADLSSFTMEQIVIAMDDQSTTSWTFVGTETGRELVDAADCMCR